MWWAAVASALAIAVLTGVADWRRRERRDLDRMGWVDWRTIQMLAVIAALICAIAATR